MKLVRIQSQGKLGETQVSIGDRDVKPGDLMKVQIHYDPQVQQTGCEVVFVNEEGRIERWSGANVDDDFEFILVHKEEGDSGVANHVLKSSGKEIMYGINGVQVFANAPMVVDIVADGFAVNLNKYFDLSTPLPNVRSIHA